ncbi:hypothetical protein KQI08_07550 [Paraeggerthella hongkongensis]|uniref:hypothetical protein n=1 Tax=Paraeggerthella hominis TaxID=2897351 RepID=UPI001C10410F|nr:MULTISPECIES: hypothetical protein [Paraeggerthella]MBU5405770.1 hypothetical protein [Paraeggerthella hongkongensis]MCD2433617.1 hypothetical protein [Paraeggerthella hominis]
MPLAIILIRGPVKLVRFDSDGYNGECGRRATVRAAPVVAAREKSRRLLRAPAPKEGSVDAAQARRPDDGGCFYGFVNCFFGIGPFDSGMLAQTPAAGLFFGDSAED